MLSIFADKSLTAPSTKVSSGLTLEATTDGESALMFGTDDNLPATTTEYIQIVVTGYTWNGTEVDRTLMGQTCIIKDLYVQLENAPNTNKSFVFRKFYIGKDLYASIMNKRGKIKPQYIFYTIGIIFLFATVAYFSYEYIFGLSDIVKTVILVCLIIIFFFCRFIQLYC